MARSLSPSNAAASPKYTAIIAGAAVIAMLYFGRGIFIPFALALVLSFLLSPLVATLQRIRLGRVPSVFIVLALCFALAATVGWTVSNQFLEITTHLGDYRSNLEEKIQTLREHNNTPFSQATSTVQQLNKELAAAPAAAANAAKNKDGGSHPARPIPVQLTAPPTNFVQDLRTLLGPLAGPAETAGLVIVFVAFMLTYREDLRNRLIRLGGEGQLSTMTQALEDASQRLGRYLLLQLAVNASFGALFGTGLYLIGIPHPLLWGAMAALLRFVPYIGVWIATAFPVLLAVAVFPGWTQALLTFGLFVLLEITIGNIVEPWLYGSHTGLSPLAILTATIFWTTLWGPVGLILAIPLTVCIVLAAHYVPEMSFLETLLGDSPALSPHELYYQRLLAMDQDEARNLAEEYVKENNLESLYESVLIPALRLAEEDRHTDVLGERSAEFISQGTRELVDDLGERFATVRTPTDGEKAHTAFSNFPIVCVPARDEADELVGTMLAQLLREGGNTKTTDIAISTMDNMLDRVAERDYRMVCISALPPFAVGQARMLCKRIRARCPRCTILVGLWGFQGGVVKAQERIGSAHADYVSTSIHEALLQIRIVADMEAEKVAEIVVDREKMEKTKKTDLSQLDVGA